MNCSGKHAAMLATCRVNGWDTATYRSPDHPLQAATRETFAELIGERVDTVAVDGCGAPLFPASLVGLARAFRRLALGLDGTDRPDPQVAEVADAIRAHPEYVSGTRRDECTLLRAIPGAIGKAGAESCYAVALPDGRAIALKTDDGAPRVRPVLMAAGAAPQRDRHRARRGHRGGAPDRTGRPARRRRAGGRDPGLLLRLLRQLRPACRVWRPVWNSSR